MEPLYWIVLIQTVFCFWVFFSKMGRGDKSSGSEEEVCSYRQLKQILLQNSACGFMYIDTELVVRFDNLQNKEDFFLQNSSGKCCYQKIRGREAPCENCIARRVMKSGKKEMEIKSLCNGINFEVTAIPVSKQDGTCIGVVLKYENITAREKMECQLAQAAEAAEAASQLHSQFLTNMSHEIRTPLNAIVGFSNCLLEESDDGLKTEYVEIINRNNHLLLQLFDNVFKQSLVDSNMLKFTYSDASVNALLNDLEELYIGKCSSEEVKLKFIYQSSKQMVYTDIQRVRDVLMRLIDNAIKFTNKGEIQVEYRLEMGKLYFEVSDTGIGIPEQKQQQIFKRFTKIDDFVNGTGLGLSICSAIVDKLGGEIGVKSVENEGSLFWFTIPENVGCESFVGNITKPKIVSSIK